MKVSLGKLLGKITLWVLAGSVSPVSAQGVVGKFTLPYHVRWGNTLLPRGGITTPLKPWACTPSQFHRAPAGDGTGSTRRTGNLIAGDGVAGCGGRPREWPDFPIGAWGANAVFSKPEQPWNRRAIQNAKERSRDERKEGAHRGVGEGGLTAETAQGGRRVARPGVPSLSGYLQQKTIVG